MSKAVLLLLCAACLASVSTAQNKLTAEVSRTRFPGGRQDSFRVSQDVWTSKDGKLSAGGYVQHDRTKFSGQGGMKNTHAGFQVQGKF